MGRAGEKRKKRQRKKKALHILTAVLLILVAVLAVLLVLTFMKQRAAETIEPEQTESEEVIVTETEPLPEPEPEPVPEVTEPETEEENSTTLIFTGDVLLSDTTLANYQNAGLSGILSDDLAETFRSADILMINEEFPFSTRGEQAPDKQYTFRTDPVYVSAFQEMGVDIAGLANNHVLDFGVDALLDSCATLDAAGIRYAGAGADASRAEQFQVIEVNGKRFGFLAASRVWPEASWAAGQSHPGVFGTYDPARLLELIRSAKEDSGCDFVTVFVHWGIERNTFPEDYQRSLGKQYAEAGADLVIGMHPHVLQGVEFYEQTPVFYSLGNFIFGGRTYDTAAVMVTVPTEGEASFSVIPCIASGGCTRRAEGSEASAVFQTLNGLSFDATLDENGQLLNVK